MAVFVLKEHAAAYHQQHYVAAEALTHSTLIDDVLDSVDDEEEATAALSAMRMILGQAGMRLSKCHSNSQKVLAAVPQEDVCQGMLDLSGACHKDVETTRLKTLGIRYDHEEDSFTFKMEVQTQEHWTKRKVLQTFPMLFDPLGHLLPFTITPRI